MFHYTVETAKSVEEAVEAVKESLKKVKFGVLWELDVPAKLQEKGVEFKQPFRILEVCNPGEAKRVLSQNSLVGYFLPCKVVVYDDHGTTKIGLPKPSAFMGLIDDAALKEVAEEVEKALIQAIEEAK